MSATELNWDDGMLVHRADFPILQQQVNDKPLVYLDNGATTQKPQAVLDKLAHYYRQDNANVHRGVHALSQRATDDYEGARETVRAFINASSTDEIIFTRGTTEAINLVANSFVAPTLKAGDEILISVMEHHSNIVPWQMLCQRLGATLKVIPCNEAGELDMAEFEALLSPKTRLLGIVHASNALGTINPVAQMIKLAHANNTPVLVDGAQAVAHASVDVAALEADFYAFSGHKLYGPTGIGVLYGRRELLEKMPPWQAGGDMIRTVSFSGTTFNDLPYKFEAGTPHIAGAIGLAAAIDYVSNIGLERIARHETALLGYATEQLSQVADVRLIGQAADKSAVLSFVLGDVHANDLGTIVDLHGVAIRAGHHCAMPVMERFGVQATARASFALYNNQADVDGFISAVTQARKMFL